ncbi:hypothetical protein [Desulfobulbus propionicus]|nr:hypothetical protein [Desulfobulbus propionicus]
MIITILYFVSLTKKIFSGYYNGVAGKIQRLGFDSLIVRRTHRHQSHIRRFFCVHTMAKLSCLGGAVWEGATPAGPYTGLSTRTVFALFPFDSGNGRQNPFCTEVTP